MDSARRRTEAGAFRGECAGLGILKRHLLAAGHTQRRHRRLVKVGLGLRARDILDASDRREI